MKNRKKVLGLAVLGIVVISCLLFLANSNPVEQVPEGAERRVVQYIYDEEDDPTGLVTFDYYEDGEGNTDKVIETEWVYPLNPEDPRIVRKEVHYGGF